MYNCNGVSCLLGLASTYVALERAVLNFLSSKGQMPKGTTVYSVQARVSIFDQFAFTDALLSACVLENTLRSNE